MTAKIMAKICHTCPIKSSMVLLDQVEAYSNQIDPIIDSLKYFEPMAFDIMQYELAVRLSDPRHKKIKDDGISLSDKLQAQAQFISQVARKYMEFDIRILLQVLVKQLMQSDFQGIIILSNLLDVLTAVPSVSELSENQVEGQAGGPILRNLAYHPPGTSNRLTKKQV